MKKLLNTLSIALAFGSLSANAATLKSGKEIDAIIDPQRGL